MQPYFFPYLGYYQLAARVDHFLFYDDAKMIKKGFIQRNSILLNGQKQQFTLPIKNLSQNRNINEHFFLEKNEKILQLISIAYKNHPFFKECFPIIENVIKSSNNVSECCENSIIEVFKYIDKKFYTSRTSTYPSLLKGQDRIIELCKKTNATHYFNPIGGKDLYSAIEFKKQKIELFFHVPNITPYEQYSRNRKNSFTPSLSIIDIIMNIPKEKISEIICKQNKTNE